jgi:hypothetical protein
VASLFLAMERLIKPKSWLWSDHLPVGQNGRSYARTTKRFKTSVVPEPMAELSTQ